jgi:phytoene dehydrogenase-like protein
MSASSFDAIVIGAGANGLVAAAALAKAGQRVLLLESRTQIGGQAHTREFAPNFHAPPLLSNAGWIPRVVARGLGLKIDRVQPHIPLSVVTEPGEALSLSNDVARTTDALRRYSARDAEQWHAFTARLHKLASFLGTMYQMPAPDIDVTARDELFGLLGLARKLRGLGRTEMVEFLRLMPMSVQELVDDWFEGAALKAAIAASAVRNLRQGPRSGGTTFVLLHHLIGTPAGSLRDGDWWRLGPDAFVRAAEDAARKQGVTVRTEARVTRIDVRADAVVGVVLEGGEEIATRRVLSTADPAQTLLRLIDPVWLDPEFLHAVRNIKFRGCTATVMFGLNALPELPGLATDALRGVISLTPSTTALERAADAAKYGQLADPPHIEIVLPTLRWPNRELAPTGKHVLVASAHYTPYRLRGTDQWDSTTRDALADLVTASLEAVSPCFSSRIAECVALTPPDIEERYGLTEGALTHGELMLDQILFMRPVPGWGRYTTPIRGLFLGGAGTHPGPHVLGGPGWLAAARMLEKNRKDAEE